MDEEDKKAEMTEEELAEIYWQETRGIYYEYFFQSLNLYGRYVVEVVIPRNLAEARRCLMEQYSAANRERGEKR